MFEGTAVPSIQDLDIVKEEIVGSCGAPIEGTARSFNLKTGTESKPDLGNDWDVIIKIESPETEAGPTNNKEDKMSVGNSANEDSECTDDEKSMGSGHTYSKSDLDNALEYLNNYRESVADVARRFNIPRVNLHDHYVKSVMKQGTGKVSMITTEEEADVRYYLLQMSKIGCLRVRRDLPGIVKYVLDKRKRKLYANGKNIPSQGWIGNFLKNHPNISTKVPKHFGQQRSSVSKEAVKAFFNTLQVFLKEEHSLNASEFMQPTNGQRIFSCDSTGFYLGAQNYDNRRSGEKSTKHFSGKMAESQNIRTVFLCISASCNVLKPLIINKGKCPTNYDSHSEVDNRYIAESSESGWITPEIFHQWLVNEFEPYLTDTRTERPVVLLFNGHTTALNIPACLFAQENQIILYSMLSDAPFLTQPLEQGCYKQIEENYIEMLNNRVTGPAKEADPEIFPYIFMKALENTNMPSCITSGFRDTGLVPFNVDALDQAKLCSFPIDEGNVIDLSHSTAQESLPVAASNEESAVILNAELHSLCEFLIRMETILPPCFIKYYEHKLSLREPVFEHSYLIWKELKKKISDVEKRLAKVKEMQDTKPFISASRVPVKITSPQKGITANLAPLQNGDHLPITKVKTSMKEDKSIPKKKSLKRKNSLITDKKSNAKKLKKKGNKSSTTPLSVHKNVKIKDLRVRLSTELPVSIKSESKGDCIVCSKMGGSNKEWIGCDCGNWCHKACVKVSVKLSNEQVRKLDFKCPICKPLKKGVPPSNKPKKRS